LSTRRSRSDPLTVEARSSSTSWEDCQKNM
jgi:hypothetical protein